MPLTKITQVGSFSDDVARQINDNFALLGAALVAQGAKLDRPAPPQSELAGALNLTYPEPPEPTAAEPDVKKKGDDKHADHKR